MIHDPIVEEVRERRQAHAKKYNYDLKKIAEALRERQRKSNREIIRNGPKLISKPAAS